MSQALLRRCAAQRALQLQDARARAECFVEYALPHEKTGRRVFNAPFHEEWQQTLRDEEKVLLMAPVEHAKALPLTTEIPTPTGFKPLADLVAGDTIYSSSGKTCQIIAMSPIWHRQTYLLKFDDGAAIAADEEHRWLTLSGIVTTNQISTKPKHYRIPVTAPVQYEQREYELTPYLAGKRATSTVPNHYMLGSIEQRQALLKGLLENDHRSIALSLQTLELARSLGFKASLTDTRRLAVSLETSKQVISVQKHQLELVRCIAVNSDDHTFLAGRSYTVTHNTQHIAVGATLHAIGNDHTLRAAVVANSGAQAAKTLSSIRRHIETNKKVQEVFPDLRPSPHEGDSWHSMALTVNRPTISKDPTIQAVGVQGSVLGSRLDLIVVDDLLDFENTRTQAARKKTVNWFDSTVLSRLTDHGRVWVIGTPWDPEDLLHILSDRPGWYFQRYSAVLNPRDPVADWKPLWPQQFNIQRLREINAGMTPINFARSYLCEARSEAAGRFQEDWINSCLALGKGLTFRQAPPTGPNGAHYPCYTGVDLAIGKNNKSDLSSLFTIAVDEAGRRIICDIQAGRWKAPDILARMKWVHQHFNSIMTVEDNGAQAFLLQWATEAGIPVHPFTTTGKNKYDASFGVESLAVEMRSEMWIIPSGPGGNAQPDEVRAWIRELLFYDPAGHTGDRIMASWLAREGSRRKRPRMRARVLDLNTR